MRLFKLAIWLTLGGLLLLARRLPTANAPAHLHASGSRWHWKRRLKTAAAVLVLLAVGGLLVAVSGIMPIKASAGHWPITRWFLQFSMRRSVVTRTLTQDVPPLDEPWMVLKGAAYYDTGCRPCHGSPALHHPRVALAMTPVPPYLPEQIHLWEPEELYYIVKHGVKFTGMPAWPTQKRDDEVWAMTAFLLEFPQLDDEQYRQLVLGPAAESSEPAPLADLEGPQRSTRQVVRESCARCHGFDGQGRGLGAFPKLAGQSAPYLAASLDAFAEQNRFSGVMEPIAAGLDAQERRALAQYYSSLAPEPPVAQPPRSEQFAAMVARGRAIAEQGVPAQRVPACQACHGPGTGPRNPIYPRLAGQYSEYLLLQLQLFQKEHRGGTVYRHVMQPIAARLDASQIRAVALYYASLPAEPLGVEPPPR